DEALDDVRSRDDSIRMRLARCALGQLRRHGERLASRADLLVKTAPRHVGECASRLASRASRIGPLCSIGLDHQADKVAASRRLIAAYDIERQLERGYTLTVDGEGRLLRSATAVSPGEQLHTRFSDGSVRSVVDEIEIREEDRDQSSRGGS
ncbi:MAG: exodeoxyribonuclease VII large subunit, partial [Acidimicrobiales bacterium]